MEEHSFATTLGALGVVLPAIIITAKTVANNSSSHLEYKELTKKYDDMNQKIENTSSTIESLKEFRNLLVASQDVNKINRDANNVISKEKYTYISDEIEYLGGLELIKVMINDKVGYIDSKTLEEVIPVGLYKEVIGYDDERVIVIKEDDTMEFLALNQNVKKKILEMEN